MGSDPILWFSPQTKKAGVTTGLLRQALRATTENAGEAPASVND